jgi:hypothetical protein
MTTRSREMTAVVGQSSLRTRFIQSAHCRILCTGVLCVLLCPVVSQFPFSIPAPRVQLWCLCLMYALPPFRATCGRNLVILWSMRPHPLQVLREVPIWQVMKTPSMGMGESDAVRARCGYWGCCVSATIHSPPEKNCYASEPTRYHLEFSPRWCAK